MATEKQLNNMDITEAYPEGYTFNLSDFALFFYQGLIDTPILKAGKRTKYRQLPSTIIIFITQEDIFKRDWAMYTFTEQCEEEEGLHLGDGTKKYS